MEKSQFLQQLNEVYQENLGTELLIEELDKANPLILEALVVIVRLHSQNVNIDDWECWLALILFAKEPFDFQKESFESYLGKL